MESPHYIPMMASSESTNPLRPYYKPPSIGVRASTLPNANNTPPGLSGGKASSTSFGSSARDALSDVDYREILGGAGATTGEQLKSLLDQAVWKYSSVFLAQPFEVAKTILQVNLAGGGMKSLSASSLNQEKRRQHAYGDARYQSYPSDDEEEDEDEDEPAYFTSNVPSSSRHISPHASSLDQKRSETSPSSRSKQTRQESSRYILDLRRPDSLTEVLSQLWQAEGAWGIWKGTNSTFLYSILLKTVETWTRSLLAALFNVPDSSPLSGASGGVAGGLDIIDSPMPFASLSLAVAAAGIAGVILCPLDMVRIRLMLAPTSYTPRSLLSNIRSLPSLICPSNLLAPIILHSTLPTFISTSTPLFLSSNFRIDPILTPATYSVCTFMSSVVELFVRLPVETVLRRGQIQAFNEPTEMQRKNRSDRPAETVVEAGPYTGLLSTMWRITREEGESLQITTKGAGRTSSTATATRPVFAKRKGQGVHGLWRGWRVGMWGLVGVWGAAGLGGGGRGGEF